MRAVKITWAVFVLLIIFGVAFPPLLAGRMLMGAAEGCAKVLSEMGKWTEDFLKNFFEDAKR